MASKGDMNLAQVALKLRRPQAEVRALLASLGYQSLGFDSLSTISSDTYDQLRETFVGADRPGGMDAWCLEPGDVVRRADVHGAHGGSRQSGIVTFTSIPDIAVFTSLKSGARFGYDRFEGLRSDGSFAYTGQGQTGNQEFKRGNRALRDANLAGRAIRLFTVNGVHATYVGKFATGSPTYWIETIPDLQGNDRDGIIFNLVPVDASSELLAPPDSTYEAPKQADWSPPNTEDLVVANEGSPKPGARTVTRIEFELQRDFGRWLQERGTAPKRLKLTTAGTVIEPDLFVPERAWVVEAKKSTGREYVRTAIGQVLDYVHIARRQELECYPVILLPGWPVRELIELAQHHGITMIVRDGDGFARLQARSAAPAAPPPGDQDLPTQIV